jgi:cytochrome c peroxidase
MVTVLMLMMSAFAEDRLPDPPLGLDLFMPVPDSNPLTPAKVALGKRLFFDKSLSIDGTVACDTCHILKSAFADSNPIAIGVRGRKGTRNAPSLVNRGYSGVQFWDGRSPSLEHQVLEPVFNPDELGSTPEALERATRLPRATIAEALASYVRTIRSGNSRFDRFVAGDTSALTILEQSGLRVFRGKGNCVACHVGPNFTDEQFHNTGVAWRDGRFLDEGRFAVSGAIRDRGAFKTPTLREIAQTAPYMHDGSFKTLEDVIDFYSDGGRANPNLDQRIQRVGLTPEEKRALAAFLQTLSGQVREGWQ